jgi:hypothetical protein
LALFSIWGNDDEAEKNVSTQQPLQVVSEDWIITHTRYIATDDKKWSAPLLYEISEIILLKDDILSYSIYSLGVRVVPSFPWVYNLVYNIQLSHYYQLVFGFSRSLSGNFIKEFSKTINDNTKIVFEWYFIFKYYIKIDKTIINICDVKKILCDDHDRLCDKDHGYDYQFTDNKRHNLRRNFFVYQEKTFNSFDKSIFNTIIADADVTNSGFSLWLYKVGQYEPLFKAVKLLLEQYHDLAERLTVLHEGRAKIIREYGKDSDVKALDNDIKKLSALGWQLTQVTKRFFVAIKLRMVKLEVAATRQQALAGLRTFENEIDAAQTTSSQSLDDIIANIDQAVRKLERAINQ